MNTSLVTMSLRKSIKMFEKLMQNHRIIQCFTTEEVVWATEQPDFQETALTKAQQQGAAEILLIHSRFRRSSHALETRASARVKLIRLANRCEAGWGIVRHYQTDRIADISDDKRRIRSANLKQPRKG